MYEVRFSEGAVEDLARLRPFDRNAILDAIEKQLRHEPAKETRNRRPLPGLVPGFEAEPPIWQLRVGDFRVFYDVDEEADTVAVRAVRRKPPERTTEEIV